jgi:hypothetical protein
METYLIITAAVLACGVILMIIRSPGFFKKFIGCAASGFAALAVVDLTSSLTGTFIAVSGWSIAAAGFLGLPGVVSMLVIKFIWQV